MILGAGLLVLAGLGLFVAGVLTGVTALYWACVGVCAVAAVLLIASRRQTGTPARDPDGGPQRTTGAATAGSGPATTAPETVRPAGTRPVDDADPAPAPAAHPPVPPAEARRTAEPRHTAEPPRPAEPFRPAELDTTAEPATTAEPFRTAEPPTAEQPVVPGPVDPDEHATGMHPSAHRTSAAGATAAGAVRGRGAHAAADEPTGAADMAEPGIEEVEVTDLLLVVDLTDEVLVVDEHPRYHLHGCRYLTGRETIPLPLDEARTDGFTPCARCTPDRHLADRERARRAGRRA